MGNVGRKELEDLLVSFLVLVLLFSNFEPSTLPYASLAVLTAFIFHELAHRQVARRYGYRAYYERWDTGIILALLLGLASRILTGTTWIFAAIGAVRIHAPYAIDPRETSGRIAFAGPLVNLIIGIAAFLVPVWSPSLTLTARTIAAVNVWLALFNLIPFPPLDGFKVFRWNTGLWAVSFGLAYLLLRIV